MSEKVKPATVQPSFSRRAVVGGLAALTALSMAGLATPTLAQTSEWPSKPIRLIVPFPPGGSTDMVGRLIGNLLAERLGQSVVVENRGGASGTIGSNTAAKAEPDGYTLVLSGVGSHAIGYSLYPSMGYTDDEFAHISLLASGPNVLVVNPEFEAQTFEDFLRLAKEKPGVFNYASSGSGSSGHLSMELLKQKSGADIVHIPFKGGAAAVTAVLGNQVNALMLNQDNVLPHVQAGKLRALAVTSSERNPVYPDVPTIAEMGFPDYSALSFFGLSAPAGTPAPIIDRLHKETVEALKDKDLREKLEQVGFVVVGSSPEEYSQFLKDEIAKWAETVKASGAQMD